MQLRRALLPTLLGWMITAVAHAAPAPVTAFPSPACFVAVDLATPAAAAPSVPAPPADPEDAQTPPSSSRWRMMAPSADRFQHASLSFAIGAGIGVATREPAAAFGGSLACGLAKELWDARSGRFDARDLLADAIGAALAAALIVSLDR